MSTGDEHRDDSQGQRAGPDGEAGRPGNAGEDASSPPRQAGSGGQSGSGKAGPDTSRPSTHGSFFNDDFTSDESLKLTRMQGSSQPGSHATSPESLRSRQPDIKIGTVIDQRFVLEKLLGRGGMNVVYRARDLVKEQARDPNPYVAIKILGAEFSKNPEAWITLQRETKKAQSLAHPRIAIIHDFQIDRETRLPFAQMEELQGEPLDKVLRRARDGLEDRELATRMVEDIAEGLKYAHQRGIVHCDLKPSNVFLTDKKEIKILDFGIARVMPGAGEDEFDAGRISALTPAYASCEMFERKPPHPADDIYALGVIAYELFTGRHPYEAVLSAREPALAAREQGLRPERPPGLGRRQWQVIADSLALERRFRPRDGAEFQRRFARRSPVPLVLSGLSLVLAGALVWATVLRPPELGPEVPFTDLPATVRMEFSRTVEEGWLAYRLNDYNGALQYFARAWDLHPFNADAMEGLEAVVKVVTDQPAVSEVREIEARLEQVEVLLSYEALESRVELIQLRDELEARLRAARAG